MIWKREICPQDLQQREVGKDENTFWFQVSPRIAAPVWIQGHITIIGKFLKLHPLSSGQKVLWRKWCHLLPWVVPGAQVRAWHCHLQEPHHRAGDGLRSGDTKSDGNQKTLSTMNLLLVRSSWRKVELLQEKLKRQTTFEDLFIFPVQTIIFIFFIMNTKFNLWRKTHKRLLIST